MATKKSAQLGTLDDNMIQCRDMRHAMAWSGDIGITRNARGTITRYTRTSTCLRECGYTVYITVDARTWEVVAVQRKYTNTNYLIKGEGRVARAEVLKESFTRAMRGVVTEAHHRATGL